MLQRRQRVRRRVSVPISVSLDASRGGVLVDVSEAGMLIRCADALDPGCTLQFQFDVPGNTSHIEGSARVVWCEPSDKAGLAFPELPESMRQRIEQSFSTLVSAEGAISEVAEVRQPNAAGEAAPEWTISGPLALLAHVLRENLRENAMGVYMLEYGDEGTFRVAKVGRAKDLRQFLSEHLGDYERFRFAYCTSEQEAFQWECRMYHGYRPPLNHSHPVRSRGTDWDCPVCRGFS